MKKLMNWLIGVSIGSAVGVAFVSFFLPLSPDDIRKRLKTGYQEAKQAAHAAGVQRRAELEAELAAMQKKQ